MQEKIINFLVDNKVNLYTISTPNYYENSDIEGICQITGQVGQLSPLQMFDNQGNLIIVEVLDNVATILKTPVTEY